MKSGARAGSGRDERRLMRNIVVMLGVLCGAFAVARLTGASAEFSGRVGMAALFCFTALGHFAKTSDMLEMLPPWVPARRAVVIASGVLELCFALGLLIPASARATAWIAIAFILAATPLNIYAASRRVRFGGHSAGPAYLLIRLPVQLLLIAWLWYFVLRTAR